MIFQYEYINITLKKTAIDIFASIFMLKIC